MVAFEVLAGAAPFGGQGYQYIINAVVLEGQQPSLDAALGSESAVPVLGRHRHVVG